LFQDEGCQVSGWDLPVNRDALVGYRTVPDFAIALALPFEAAAGLAQDLFQPRGKVVRRLRPQPDLFVMGSDKIDRQFRAGI
jgi:hypothetical protein